MMTVNPAIINEQKLEQRHMLLIILTTCTASEINGCSKLRNGFEFHYGGNVMGLNFVILSCKNDLRFVGVYSLKRCENQLKKR